MGFATAAAKNPPIGNVLEAEGREVDASLGTTISSAEEKARAGVEDLEGAADVCRSRSVNEDLVLCFFEYRPGSGIDSNSTSDVPNCGPNEIRLKHLVRQLKVVTY